MPPVQLVVIGAVAAFLVFAAIIGKISEKELKKRFMAKESYRFGKVVERTYRTEEFEAITHYHKYKTEKEPERFTIDEITAGDINLDELFCRINYTQSSAGDEMVYHRLRTPFFTAKELMDAERLITYFDTHEKERLTCQWRFHQLGHSGRVSLTDHIHNFAGLSNSSNFPHFLSIGLLIFSIASLWVDIAMGMMFLIFVLFFNIITYYKKRSEIGPYQICMNYIVRLTQVAEDLGADKSLSELSAYTESLKEAAKPMTPIKRFSALISPADQYSGDLLQTIYEYIRIITHVDLIAFNLILKETRKHLSEVEQMQEVVGTLECAISVASYRRTLPVYCLPELKEGKEWSLSAEEMVHPLLEKPVANSLSVKKGVLLTGSNASGKSTFLKTVALCQVMAQTIHTVCATHFQSSFLKIFSSMSLRDSIASGDSYYMVEIKALKRIMDESQEDFPVICFVDEVLRGTNTVERIAASSQILVSLSEKKSFVFAATHDIELTHMLEKYYENYHFTEEVTDEDISFSYKLLPGRATTRNAIKLLSIIGYDETVIKEAEKLAEAFTETGIWKTL